MSWARELWSAFSAEMIKLRRSLVLLLIVAAPAMIGILGVMMQVSGNGPDAWEMRARGTLSIWALFMLPMTLTAITALLGQIESGPGMWTHLGALPTRRSSVLIGKYLAALLTLVLMSSLLLFVEIGGGVLAGALTPEHALEGPVPVELLSGALGLMLVASLLMLSIQLSVAVWSNSFVTPVVVGISGTFVALVATAADNGKFFPWLLPVNVLVVDEGRKLFVLLFGSVGGLALASLMIPLLARRDVTAS